MRSPNEPPPQPRVLRFHRHGRMRGLMVLGAWWVGALSATTASSRALLLRCDRESPALPTTCVVTERTLVGGREKKVNASDLLPPKVIGRRIWVGTETGGSWWSPALGRSFPLTQSIAQIERIRRGETDSLALMLGYDRRLSLGIGALWLAVGALVARWARGASRLRIDGAGDEVTITPAGGGTAIALSSADGPFALGIAREARRVRLFVEGARGGRRFLEAPSGTGAAERDVVLRALDAELRARGVSMTGGGWRS
jgi:hypothetical protein